MRLSSGISWAVSLLAARTIATDASIYISDSPSGASREALSPATTRLLLARRLGLSQYHSLKRADDTTLRVLNDFGGEQKTLLSMDEPWTGPQRNLVIVEDVGGVGNPKGKTMTIAMSFIPANSCAQSFSVLKSIESPWPSQTYHTLPIPFS